MLGNEGRVFIELHHISLILLPDREISSWSWPGPVCPERLSIPVNKFFGRKTAEMLIKGLKQHNPCVLKHSGDFLFTGLFRHIDDISIDPVHKKVMDPFPFGPQIIG